MKWSYRIGEWFGIGVHVHLTFALLLGWIALGTFGSTGSVLATGVSVLFVLCLFGFVVLHEYGHALTARHFGIRTRQITLYPIGGVASLEGMPESPRAQALVAVAGPMVNFALAGGLSLVGALFGVNVFALPTLDAGLGALLGPLVQANLALGLFNLIPALPMDGGRILKALLSMRMDAGRATQIAARVARTVAIAMAAFGLFGDPSRPMLVAIAAFVWFASKAEERFSARTAEATRFNAFPTDAYRQEAPPEAPGSAPGQARVRYEVFHGPFGPVVRVVRVDGPG